MQTSINMRNWLCQFLTCRKEGNTIFFFWTGREYYSILRISDEPVWFSRVPNTTGAILLCCRKPSRFRMMLQKNICLLGSKLLVKKDWSSPKYPFSETTLELLWRTFIVFRWSPTNFHSFNLTLNFEMKNIWYLPEFQKLSIF